MTNPVECPFCGVTFYKKNYYGHHMHPPAMPDDDCPLAGCALKEQQWNMRPPKKEPRATQNEIERRLMALVKELMLIKTSKE